MNKRAEFKYLFLIIVIFTAACIETDIYLPAFPDMMAGFGVSEGAIQSLLTWNFFGICISGPLYGPLSDTFGRKKPLMIALAIFLLGSILAFFSQNFDQMLYGRILQGLGSGGCFTLGTAIIFDAFQKERAISATNHLNTIIPIMMSAAPVAGGYLNRTFGFRSNFLAIVLFVLLGFIVTLFLLVETLPPQKRAHFQLKSLLQDFKTAFTSLPLWQLTMVVSLNFSAYMAFLSGTAVLFVVEFGMAKTLFPVVQALILGGWLAGSLMLRRLISRWGTNCMKKAGLWLCASGAVLLGIFSWIAPRDPYLLTSGMVLYAWGSNWVIGLYFPEAMGILPHIKGIVASLLTSGRLLMAALVVGITASLYNGTIYPLTLFVLGAMGATLLLLIFYEKRRALPVLTPIE